MNERYEKAKQILQKYGQEQLLLCYDKMTEEKKEELLDQILGIDYELIQKLYKQTQNKDSQDSNTKIEPMPAIDKEKLTKEESENYEAIGMEKIKENKYAVVTMAGGQGTRLGHPGPKGTFDLGLSSHKSLFEIYCDQLSDFQNKFGVYVYWYIMTSKQNHKETTSFFEKHQYFGYPKEKIKFFEQGELPMIDKNGKILLEEDGFVKEAADGHGGILHAMNKNKIIDDMKQEGIEWVTIVGVDNVLVKMIDPLVIGLAVDKNIMSVSKSVIKREPKEKVGVFCKKNGKPAIVEYIEISEEMSELRNENGELVYGDSNIIYHLFNIKALEEKITSQLPYHVAFKKANYLDEKGNLIVSNEPNAYKFEAFIFDLFELLDDMLILRVKREEAFAPIKNAEGSDSPETARELYKNYFKIGK